MDPKILENRSLSPPWAPKGPQGPSGHQNMLKYEGFSTLRLEKHEKTLCFSTPAPQLETIWILKCFPIAPLSVQFWKGPAALAKPFGYYIYIYIYIYPPPCLWHRWRAEIPAQLLRTVTVTHFAFAQSLRFAQSLSLRSVTYSLSHFVTFTSL